MNPRTLCIVIHDVAPATWPDCRRLLDALAKLGEFPVTLLAVPRYHGEPSSRAFEKWLCERSELGDEIALHGYTHLDEGTLHGATDFLWRGVYTRREGEFSDLSFDDAMFRLCAGRQWLNSLGLEPQGFVPPAWLIGEQAWQALQCHAFAYTCTVGRIHLLPQMRSVACQSQVFSTSSALRRSLSLAWNESLAFMQEAAPLVRLELHPDDLDYAPVRDSWRRLAARQLRTRRVSTLQQFVAELKTEPAPIQP